MLTIGQVLAQRYKVTGNSSGGGTETTYEATDVRLEKPVTIREFIFEDEATRAALESEARLLIELRHSSLPSVIDQFTEGRQLYLVTEFIGEESLAERILRGDAPPPVEDVLDWAWEMLNLLEYLHGRPQPIVHRHIEPSNIYVSEGCVFLVGLGSPSQNGGGQSAPDRIAYVRAQALGYASPEQIRGMGTTNPANDIYSLGATLYALLTNVVPDDALQRALSESDPLEPIKTLRRDLEPHVARAVTAALALNSRKRPQTAREMRDLLFKIATATNTPRRGYVRAVATAGIVTTLVLLAGTVWHFYPPPCDKIPPFVSQRVTLPCNLAAAPPPPGEPQLPPKDAAANTKARSDELAAAAAERQQRGDYDGALLTADEALKANPDNVYAHAVKCDVTWDTKFEAAEYETASQLKGTSEVKQCAEKILSLVKEARTAEDHAAHAWANTALGKSHAAVTHADKALSLKRDLVMAYMARAVTALGGLSPQEPRYQRALADLREVLWLKPNYPQAHYLRSRVYFLRDLLPDAEEAAEKAAQIYPQAKSFTLLGDISKMLGDIFNQQNQAKADEEYDKAAKQYNKALGKNPLFLPAYKQLARLHYQRENWGDAHGAVERGLKVRNDAELHDLNGQIYEAHGNQQMAVAAYRRAHELDKTNRHYEARLNAALTTDSEETEDEEGDQQ